MRGIVGLFIVIVIGAVALVYLQARMSRDPGPIVLVAFGEPNDGQMEVNICIPIVMRKAEVPPDGGMPRKLDPTKWAQRHWELRSASGDTSEMSSIGSSLLVSDTKAGGAPDFWIKTSAKLGEAYTLIYTPDIDEGKRFKFEFEAKDGIKPRQRVEFEEME